MTLWTLSRNFHKVDDSAGYPIGEGEDVFDETLIDSSGVFANRQHSQIPGNETPQFIRFRPHGQFHLLESAGNLWVEAHDVEGFMGARGDDRYAPVVGEEFDHVQGGSLLTSTARKQMLDFVDDEDARVGVSEVIAACSSS